MAVNAQTAQQTLTSQQTGNNANSVSDNTPIWTANVVPLCNGVCLEGNVGIWQVQLNNVGKVKFQIQGISLVDSSGIPFGSVDLTKQNAIIEPGQSGKINVTGVIPPPTRASTLFYKLGYMVGGKVYPDSNYRRMVVMPISNVECTSNDFCSSSDICYGFRCVPYSMFNKSAVPKHKQKIWNQAGRQKAAYVYYW